MSAQTEYQRRHKEAGLCRRCPKPARRNAAGKVMVHCADCAAKVNKAQNARIARRKAAAAAETLPQRIVRRVRRALGG